MSETEDVPYNVDAFATPEKEKEPDEDQVNKSVLVELQQYLKKAIADNSTVEAIDLTEQANLNPGQQIAVQKHIVNHLRNIKTVIDDKLKELV